MCDVLYDVTLYCNVVKSFVVERHNWTLAESTLCVFGFRCGGGGGDDFGGEECFHGLFMEFPLEV